MNRGGYLLNEVDGTIEDDTYIGDGIDPITQDDIVMDQSRRITWNNRVFYNLDEDSDTFGIKRWLNHDPYSTDPTNRQNVNFVRRHFRPIIWDFVVLEDVSLGFLNYKLDEYGNNALTWASKNGISEIVKMLLDKGVNPNIKNTELITPLSFASEKGYVNIVKMLLDKGADPNIKDKWGQTALIYASQNGHENIVKMLLDKDADPNIKTEKDNNSLYVAAQNGRENIVKMLLDKGADPNTKTKKGNTALKVASQNGYKNIVNMLISATKNGRI
jgi:ankyrin repeat protein